ncbi:MAG: hypothetical protein IIA73_05535 [Proteobacteria bacterium]|nr:hypothetical protein [Pseudomonadota bacterium]
MTVQTDFRLIDTADNRVWEQHSPRPFRSTDRTKASPIFGSSSTEADLTPQDAIIATLVERRPGGQRRLALGEPGSPGKGVSPALKADRGAATPSAEGTSPTPDEALGHEAGAPERGHETTEADRTGDASLPGSKTRKKPATYSLSLRFESRPDDPALGRLVESTVWVNEAHPAYERALASRSEGYHVALTVALTLAPLTVEPARVQEFVSTFLARWGEAGTDDGRKKGS